MRIIKIKNNQTSSDTYCGQEIAAGQYYQLQSEAEIEDFSLDIKVNEHHAATPQKIIINDGESDLSFEDGERLLKGNHAQLHQPFAAPTYRTKMDATPSLTSVSANSSETIDFQLTAERYVSGGRLVITGAEMGDYVTAEVYDVDSVIPEVYRSALCENWPSVAKYITKMWIDPSNDNYIDTRPLNAKISAGLYLRITYTAVNSGSTRSVGINYNLTQKL